jgi:competence protein ComEA
LIDVDGGSVIELTRLPKVGPRLAKVIVANREAHGPFRDLSGLDRVEGIGPGLLKLLAPHVTFSAAGVPRTPPAGPVSLNLNQASQAELDALPGIGPAKAAAILRYREQHGQFGSIDELERVPGFGAAAVARLRNQIAAP